MSASDPLPASGEDAARIAARVSTKPGWWSVGLPLAAVAVNLVIAWIYIAFKTDDSSIAMAMIMATTFAYLATVGMLIAAVATGVVSIVSASRRPGLPGRTTAIVLGCIGLALSALIGFPVLRPMLGI